MWSDCVAWHSANRMQTNDKHGTIGEKSFDLFLTAYLSIYAEVPKTISRTIHMYSCSRFPLLPHCSFRTTFTLYVCFEVLLSRQKVRYLSSMHGCGIYSQKCLLTSMEPTNISQVSFKSTFNRNMAKYDVIFPSCKLWNLAHGHEWRGHTMLNLHNLFQTLNHYEKKNNNNSSYEEKTLHFYERNFFF